MSNPDQITQLIDAAVRKAGSEYNLAKEMCINRSSISQWKSGHSKCSPEDAALMAEIAGLNPEEWMARVAILKHEGTPKGEKLKAVLKKAFQVTGDMSVSYSVNAGKAVMVLVLLNQAKDWILNTMYIM